MHGDWLTYSYNIIIRMLRITLWKDEKGEPNPVIESALKRYLTEGNEYKEIYEAEGAEERFGDNLGRLIQMVKNWAPQKNPTRWSKAWWTAEITELRRVYTSAARRVRRDGSGVEERNKAKKSYKSGIDKAKRKHWNNFLASATKNDVWTAHQFTKQRQPVRIPGGHNDSPDQTSQRLWSTSSHRVTIRSHRAPSLEKNSRMVIV